MTSLALSPAGAEIQAVKFQLSESFRKEYRRITEFSGFGSTSTGEEAHKGKASFELTLKGSFAGLNRDSLVVVNVGDLKISQTLGSDPNYTSVSTKAELKQYVDSTKPIKTIASSLKISWTPTLMTMKYEGAVPPAASLLAVSVMEQRSGEVSSDAEITGSVSGTLFTAPFSFSGKVGFTERGNDQVYGSVTTVSLKGRL
jgi:hypothetical protein